MKSQHANSKDIVTHFSSLGEVKKTTLKSPRSTLRPLPLSLSDQDVNKMYI